MATRDADTRDDAVTEDALLGGSVRLLQPRHGYRAAIDPVLLAAAVPARAGQIAADVGMGVGAAALCLAARVPGLTIDGLEAEAEMSVLARRNAKLNRMEDRVTVTLGDVAMEPRLAGGNGYDHVFSNPPYVDADDGNVSPNRLRAIANVAGGVRLEDWLAYCLALLRPKGSLTLIHRADRLDRLLGFLNERLGEIVVFPLWPKQGRPAKRILLRGRRGVATSLRLLPGLVLHTEDGAYTAAAQAVLREGEALDLDGAGGDSAPVNGKAAKKKKKRK